MAIKTLLITQARCGSTRLPGKILKTVQDKTLLEIHIDRLKKCKKVDAVLVATTTNIEDKIIYNKSYEWGVLAFKGSENDVLDRFYQAAKPYKPEWIVRVTSDCPLLDPVLVDEVINFVQDGDFDYGTNTIIEHFPDGQDVEVLKFKALETAWKEAKKKSEREHVTPYILNNSSALGGTIFSSINYPCENDFSHIRMTVDESRDFELIKKLIIDLGADKSWEEYNNYIINNELTKLNDNIIRNEGYLKSLEEDKVNNNLE